MAAENKKNLWMESARYLLLFIWTLNVMDGFKTSRYITLSGLAVRCCVAGQRGCRLCELHEYIKGALPRTYTLHCNAHE